MNTPILQRRGYWSYVILEVNEKFGVAVVNNIVKSILLMLISSIGFAIMTLVVKLARNLPAVPKTFLRTKVPVRHTTLKQFGIAPKWCLTQVPPS